MQSSNKIPLTQANDIALAHSELAGIRIGAYSLENLAACAVASIAAGRRPFVVSCANPHSIVHSHHDETFREALNSSDAVLPDGVGCLVMARVLGKTIGPRITGHDFFDRMMKLANEQCGKVFFLGSTEASLAALCARARLDFPKVQIRTHSPPFGVWKDDENAKILSLISDYSPDILWVGMTAPKQEKWVACNRAALNVPIVASIGAVFDYYSGVVKRPPEWAQGLGIEWLLRLFGEPRRLWRRTIISGPLFVYYCLKG